MSPLFSAVSNGPNLEFTGGSNLGRKLAVPILAVAVFLPLIVYAGVQLTGTGSLLPALENTLSSPLIAWTPLAG